MDTLENILDDEPIAEAAVEEAEPEGQPRAPDGKFAPKGETESASPAPVEKEPEFDHQAVIGERRRRQEAEARAAELEQRLAELQNPPAPAPDLWENTEGWQQHFGGQVVSTAVQQATFQANLNMSEMMMRQNNPDFDDMKATFLELMAENPTLQQQALADPHPWNKAYQIAKNHKTMQELGTVSVDEMKAKLREEIKAELAAQPIPNLPNSLADSQSSRSSVGVFKPPTLDDILNG